MNVTDLTRRELFGRLALGAALTTSFAGRFPPPRTCRLRAGPIHCRRLISFKTLPPQPQSHMPGGQHRLSM